MLDHRYRRSNRDSARALFRALVLATLARGVRDRLDRCRRGTVPVWRSDPPSGRGRVILLNAGEIHTGEACDHRGFGFRMLYIPESTFREVASGWPPAGPNLHSIVQLFEAPCWKAASMQPPKFRVRGFGARGGEPVRHGDRSHLDLRGLLAPSLCVARNVGGYSSSPRLPAYPPEFQVLNVLSTAGATVLGGRIYAAYYLSRMVAEIRRDRRE